MSQLTELINIQEITFDPEIPRPSADLFQVFPHVHWHMPNSSQIPPLTVRLDPVQEKYILAGAGPKYEFDCLTLAAGSSLGLAKLPCSIVDDFPADCSQPCQVSHHPVSAASSRQNVSADMIERLLIAYLPRILVLSRSFAARSSPRIRQVADDLDWTQEILIALWRELERRSPRMLAPDVIRRFIFGICRNQAARAARLTQRQLPLSDLNVPIAGGSILDDVVRDCEVKMLVNSLQEADTELRRILSALPSPHATAISVWLDGESVSAAATASRLSSGRIRRLIERILNNEALRPLLLKARCQLKTLHHGWPSEARLVHLGRLKRLILC